MRQGPVRQGPVRLSVAALAALLLAPAAPHHARAQTGPAPVELAIQGRVEHPRTLALAELRSLPPVTLSVDYHTAHGLQRASFTGALLWPLVAAAGPVDEPGRATRLQHTFLARGRDGYAVALAIGELHPDFENKQVLVAYEQDGKPLDGLRLIVPADAHAGRAVRDLVAVEVR